MRGILRRIMERTAAVVGGGSAPGVYGLLIAFSVATALSLKGAPSGEVMAAAVAGSGLVFWAAHIHAHVVALWIRREARPSFRDVRHEAREQLPLILACLPAAVILSAAGAGLWSVGTALWIITGVTIGLLALWGIAIARIARLGFVPGLIVTGINVGIGLLIVVLKVAFSH